MSRRCPRPPAAERQSGFSLVEVVLALGLLASVLIAISGLFVLSNRQLDGGRNHSIALSVARAIVEEMNGWTFRQTWSSYGFDGSAGNYTVDSRTNARASKWQDALNEELTDSHAEVSIVSFTESGPGPALRQAAAIRVEVSVHWKEGVRQRSVKLASVRL